MSSETASLAMSPVRGRIRVVLAMTVILSACSLMYGLLIAQTLSLSAGNTVVWYSLSVGIYICTRSKILTSYDSSHPSLCSASCSSR